MITSVIVAALMVRQRDFVGDACLFSVAKRRSGSVVRNGANR
jgi:protein-tyrosine phosphatase